MPVKLALADQIRDGFARRPPRRQLTELCGLLRRQRIAAVCDEVNVIHAEHCAQQHARIDSRDIAVA